MQLHVAEKIDLMLMLWFIAATRLIYIKELRLTILFLSEVEFTGVPFGCLH
jgi:hypothetical protein